MKINLKTLNTNYKSQIRSVKSFQMLTFTEDNIKHEVYLQIKILST